MKANICGRRYTDVYGGWYNAYRSVMDALHELDIEICISPHLDMQNIPDYATVGIVDDKDAIYVYNHTYVEEVRRNGFLTGKKTLFIKPTLPTPNHFTLDSSGYAAASSITYKKPSFEYYDSTYFFNTTVPEIIRTRPNKWQDRDWCEFGDPEELELPDNHVLVLGQLPQDETCSLISFGDHFKKLCAIVDHLDIYTNIVVKLHPHLLDSSDEWYVPDPLYFQKIEEWREKGIIVLTGYTSLFDILPKTRVAIVENSTSGLECLLHQVPVISYGFPEYHWVTKDLRHLHQLSDYIKDLSWHIQDRANSFTAWYFEQYLCNNTESAKRRILEIFAE